MLVDEEETHRAPGLCPAGMHEALYFEALFARYLDDVFAYVRHRVPLYEDAEDITIETFEAALTSRTKLRREDDPKAWLLGIARRKTALAARRFRQGRCREWLDGNLSKTERDMLDNLLVVDSLRLPEDAVLRDEARAVVRRLLTVLPDAQQEAVLLRFYHGLSAEEIGRVMGRRVPAVNSLLQRARATIFREGKAYFQS